MSTLMVVDHDRGAAAVARRVREECARLQIKYYELARAIGKSPQAISYRINGKVPWDVEELHLASEATGMSYDYITAGLKTISDASKPLVEPSGSILTREYEPRKSGLRRSAKGHGLRSKKHLTCNN
ncbi:helix-turn-helix domain-containing protein, partial [Mycobacteroides abscessus]